ncbi:MAG: PH domain-containing protein [Actinobacteria bacterium]|nr:PH domain-containing protein [Actinomycetota bacterium]
MSSPTPKPMTQPAPGGQPEVTGEREMFRLNAPVVIFYIWLAFAAINVVDLAVQAKPRFALVVGLVILTITGVAYACGLRPRVIADTSGLTVINPVRQFRLPWSVIRAVDVRDWVRFSCRADGDAGHDRIVESWALFATARVKRNYTQRAQDYAAKTPATNRMPDEARRLMSQPAVVIIAHRIEQRLAAEQAARAKAAKAAARTGTAAPAADAGAAVTTRWAWLPIALMVAPAIALAVVLAL